MNPNPFRLAFLVAGISLSVFTASAQEQTPPLTAADKEAFYTKTLEDRADAILKDLALTDATKAAKVREAVIAQYRALRARDEAILVIIKEKGAEVAVIEARKQSKTLHDQFLSTLAVVLTPEQIDVVKDRMTYGKVKFTYDAYCNIVPNLSDKDKAQIMELLKEAREEAIVGGTAAEKTAIFQKYKDQINGYLTAQGHDVQKAFQEWDAKQAASASAPK